MARYEVVISKPPARATDRDADLIGFRVLKDGDYFKYVAVIVSGRDQMLTYTDEFGKHRFWPAVAQCVLDRLPTIAAEPTNEDPTQAHVFHLEPGELKAHVNSVRQLPSINEGNQVGERDI